MDDANILLGIETARDAGLICDNEHEQPGVVKRLDRRFGALDPTEPGDGADIPVVVIEHPVAVEKGRRLGVAGSGISSPSSYQVGRHADIDEIAVVFGTEQATGPGKLWKDIVLERTARAEVIDQGVTEGIDATADKPRAQAASAARQSR